MNNGISRMKSSRADSRKLAVSRPVAVGRLLLITFCLLSLAQPGTAQTKRQAAPKRAAYVCVMDPEVKSARPGRCPRCGMALRKATIDQSTALAEVKRDGPPRVAADHPAQIPDAMVYDQDGKPLRFYSDLVKGKTVAINFIFTTCTTICPPLTATFRKVQQELGDRVGRDVQLISVSVDPVTDVPERLKAFAAKFKAGPGWTFVTGSKPEMAALLKALGANAADKNEHSPMVLVGNDRAAYWTRTYGLAPASALISVIADAATKTADSATVRVPVPVAQQELKSAEKQVEKRVAVDPAAKDQSPVVGEVKKAKTPAEAAAAYFPNTVLLTQNNQPVHFFDDLLKGKVVVINFMFTTCTSICPAMTANLLKVQEYLGERVGNGVNMISITVDPTVDTPDVLKKYAEKMKVRPGWVFLTGNQADIDTVLRKVGGSVKDKNDHTTLLMVGNVATGQWMKVFAMAKPAEIADAIIKVAESN
jgi:cytochrome oxidase Cu insertion factor (SCO1/SenC/PrrC family)